MLVARGTKGVVHGVEPMKTSLDHLPVHKRDLITAIADLVRGGAPVDMVILFGSYARGDWVEDPLSGYLSSRRRSRPGRIRGGSAAG